MGWGVDMSKKQYLQKGFNLHFYETRGHSKYGITKNKSKSHFGKKLGVTEFREISKNFNTGQFPTYYFTLRVIILFKIK